MERTRFRLVELAEWLIALTCAGVAVVVGVSVAGNLHHVQPVVPVLARAATVPPVPANVPPGSILVPELVLPDGKLLRVGERASILERFGLLARGGPVTIDRIDTGERESRSYLYEGMAFFVVTADDRIAAIYR